MSVSYAGAKAAVERLPGLKLRLQPLLLSLILALPLASAAAPPEQLKPTAVEQVISKVVAVMISRHHYAGHELDTELSKLLFQDFFNRLDHNRSFFLASDIEDFRSYESILTDLLMKGNVDFAFEAYDRFKQRVRERVSFVNQRLQEPFDFTLDEEIVYERSDEPWCETTAELDEVWRKRIKNNMLVYKLMERPDTLAAEMAPPDGDDLSMDAEASIDAEMTSSNAISSKTPQERVEIFYDRYLKQIEAHQGMDVLEIYLTVFARLYDPHSSYMAPDTEEDFDIAMRLSLQGIGALLTSEDSIVRVADIIPGGPAERDGRLKKGDRIIAVAQEGKEPVDIIDMPLRRVVRMIRGPKGTTVYLTVLEAGKGLGSVPVFIDIVRDEVKLTAQEAKSEYRSLPLSHGAGESTAATEQKVGIIRLPSFYADFQGKHEGNKDYKSSVRDVRNLIEEAKEKNVAGLIVDLRSNGGGSLEEAIEMAGLFFDEGPVVQVRKSNGEIEKRYDPDSSTAYDGPLVILVDRFSASASEIVAAALQDYGRGVILGEEATHGKGTVQTIYHLHNRLKRSPIFRDREPGSIKFTMAKFYRITGRSTQVEGVAADIALPSFTDHVEVGERHLPHVLPWDQINPLKFNASDDVTPYLNILAERSEERRGANEDFQAYVEKISLYEARKKQKTLTLNKEKRIELQQEDRKWSEKLQKVNNRRSYENDTDDHSDADRQEDLILAEALHVMADLIQLQEGRPLPPLEIKADLVRQEAVGDLDPGLAKQAEPANRD